MPKRLVIVESPAKARTISGYLGPDFVVESSVGHIRDLPDSAAEIPEKYKGEPWARLGVDVEHGFEPLYVVDPDKKKTVAQLKKQLAGADELLLATDEDREGEAIAWHLLEVLKPKVPVRRMVFHEITRDAIEQALDETREVDERLVDAQESRRILDRLYGYEVSPVLWKKVMRGLSAGRVQSVATRLVVAARARADGVPRGRVVGHGRDLRSGRVRGEARLPRRAARCDGPRLRPRRQAPRRGAAARRGGRARARRAAPGLVLPGRPRRAEAVRPPPEPAVHDVDAAAGCEPEAPLLRADDDAARPAPVRERLHHVHAHRLDDAVGVGAHRRPRAGRRRSSAPTTSRRSRAATSGRSRTRRRPTRRSGPSGDRFRTPQDVRSELSPDEHALYELIWMRTIASQMKDAQGQTVSLRIAADSSTGEPVEFGASGTVITFRGFLAAYEEGRDADRAAQEEDEERRLPNLSEGDAVELKALQPQGHETSPPARYTEATLVRTLEELGIGRPSTYASILGTILDRGYVFKRGTALVPAFLAFSVVGLLEKHFGRLVDYDFTASMEDDLDRIAAGDEQRVEWLGRFYFGDGPGAAGASSLGCMSSCRISARSTRARSTRSRSATGSSCASAAMARTSSATDSERACPTSSPPTS